MSAISHHSDALPPDDKNSVKIIAHQNSTKQVIKDAKDANKMLAKLLKENHFTLKLVLAIKGRPNTRT